MEASFQTDFHRASLADQAELEPAPAATRPGGGHIGSGPEFWNRPASDDALLLGRDCGRAPARAEPDDLRHRDGLWNPGPGGGEAWVFPRDGLGQRPECGSGGTIERPEQ